MTELLGKKAIITGASKNIGAAIAVKFASKGADVLLQYNSDQVGIAETQEEVNKFQVNSHILQSNFQNNRDVANFAKNAISLLDGVDILVNCASDYDTSNFVDLEHAKMNELLQVGAVAPMVIVQQIAKYLIANTKTGSVINISSVSGVRPYKNRTAHAATKSALNMITQNAALDLAEYGIRVNAICPGAVPYEGGGEYITQNIPLGRVGKPIDIANAALFLASEQSSWMTGQILIVDGGQSLSY